MEFIIIGFTALVASLLTFFSGFGLSTILTPVFIVFFPIEVAIAVTAIVHFLNNLFKVALVGKEIVWRVTLKFGIPAVVGAFAGASLLIALDTSTIIYTYTIGGHVAEVELIKLIISVLMMAFAILELIPAFNAIQFDENKLTIGGIVSGFFGGLSGHQGALRSLFLLKCGLSKQGFIATGVAIATIIDITRISVYMTKIERSSISDNYGIMAVALLSAFAGAILGKKLLKKITLTFVQVMVSVLIIVLSLLLGGGII